jgi:hypothetical protein
MAIAIAPIPGSHCSNPMAIAIAPIPGSHFSNSMVIAVAPIPGFGYRSNSWTCSAPIPGHCYCSNLTITVAQTLSFYSIDIYSILLTSITISIAAIRPE